MMDKADSKKVAIDECLLVNNADDNSLGLYESYSDLAFKVLRLPQAQAIVLMQPVYQQNNEQSSGIIFYSSGRNDQQYMMKTLSSSLPGSSDINVLQRGGAEPDLIHQAMTLFPELSEKCRNLLTEEIELKISSFDCYAIDVLWYDAEITSPDVPIRQVVLFPLKSIFGDGYFYILLTGTLLPVFLRSIKLLIQTANVFSSIKLNRQNKSKSTGAFLKQVSINYEDLVDFAKPLLDSAFEPSVIVSESNHILYANTAFLHLICLGKESEVLGCDLTRYIFIHQKSRKNTAQYVVDGCTDHGQALVLQIKSNSFQFKNQNLKVLHIKDQTKSIWQSGQKKIYQHQLSSIFDLALVGIFEINVRNECVFSNAYLDKLLGKSIAGVGGYSWLCIFNLEDQQEIQNRLPVELQYTGIYTKFCQIITASKEHLWIRFHACRNQAPNGGFVGTITDETAQRMQEVRLRELAELDQLTGLVNRHVMYSRLRNAIEYTDRYGAFVVMCLDLDGFKNINDSLGHDVGDALLIEVSKRLKLATRKVDVIVRMGGDEFVVLLANGINETAAGRVAHDIITAIRKPFCIDNRTLYITVSVGIVICDKSDILPGTLLKQGDIALYQAKAAGRNNFQFFTPELDKAAREKLDLITQLHEALSKQQFSVEYQPQINLKTGLTFGFEALLRWSPDNEARSPSEFIGLLEDTGLIHDVSTWMLEVCFADFARWRKNGWASSQQKLSVNISSSQLLLKGFVDQLDLLCREHGLKPSDLILELSETSFMDRVLKGESVVQEIKMRGFSLAIDDFGTGYSSIWALIELKVDFLKIDTSLLRDIFNDQEDRAVVDSILAIGKRLGIDIIAVGVDDESKIDYLNNHGCHIGQGFVFFKPLTAGQVESSLFLGCFAEI